MEEIAKNDFMKLLNEKNIVIDELKSMLNDLNRKYEKRLLEKDFEVRIINIR